MSCEGMGSPRTAGRAGESGGPQQMGLTQPSSHHTWSDPLRQHHTMSIIKKTTHTHNLYMCVRVRVCVHIYTHLYKSPEIPEGLGLGL